MNTTLTTFNEHPNIIRNREQYKDKQRQIEFRADKKLNNGKWQNNIEYIFQIDRRLLMEREKIYNKNGPSYKKTLKNKYKIIDYNIIQNRQNRQKHRQNIPKTILGKLI